MDNVIGITYSSRQFSYNKDRKMFVGNISEVPGVLRQLWNDSMDVGFGIRSEKTGRVVYFTLDQAVKDDDGDVQYWSFTMFQYPEGLLDGNITAVIFTD